MQEKMAYLETSAALNVNIDRIFEMLSGKMNQLEKLKNGSESSSSRRVGVHSLVNSASKNRNKKCCE
jgi:hypothetical protein